MEGCCHGALDVIYKTLKHIEQVDKIKIDLLLICGDFQVMNVSCYRIWIKTYSLTPDFLFFSQSVILLTLTLWQSRPNIDRWVRSINTTAVNRRHHIRLFSLAETMKLVIIYGNCKK